MCKTCGPHADEYEVRDNAVIRTATGEAAGHFYRDSTNRFVAQHCRERPPPSEMCGYRYQTPAEAVCRVIRADLVHLREEAEAEAEYQRHLNMPYEPTPAPETKRGRCDDCGRYTAVTLTGDMSGIPGWACSRCEDYPSFA